MDGMRGCWVATNHFSGAVHGPFDGSSFASIVLEGVAERTFLTSAGNQMVVSWNQVPDPEEAMAAASTGPAEKQPLLPAAGAAAAGAAAAASRQPAAGPAPGPAANAPPASGSAQNAHSQQVNNRSCTCTLSCFVSPSRSDCHSYGCTCVLESQKGARQGLPFHLKLAAGL